MENAFLDRPTFVERLTQIIRTRYWAAVLIWVIILGPVLQILSSLFQMVLDATRTNTWSYWNPIRVVNFAFIWIPRDWTPIVIVTTVFWIFSLWFPFYGVRYIRKRTLSEKDSGNDLLQNDSFQSYFKGFPSMRPQLVIAGILLAIDSLIEIASNGLFYIPNILVAQFTVGLLLDIIWGSVYWTYFSSMIGFHRLSKSIEIHADYVVDSFLGLKSIGSTLLSVMGIFVVFSLTQLFTNLIVIEFTFAAYGGLNLSLTFWLPLAASIVDTVFGIGIFLVALSAFHRRVRDYLKDTKEKLRSRISIAVRGGSDTDFRRLEYLEHQLSSVKTWLYDLRNVRTMLRLFGTLISAILSVLLAAIVALLLGLHLP